MVVLMLFRSTTPLKATNMMDFIIFLITKHTEKLPQSNDSPAQNWRKSGNPDSKWNTEVLFVLKAYASVRICEF